jgi:hypothetical protein
MLLHDLTSSYFESPRPANENDKRRFGHSRDKRRDCVQVLIALIVTPDGARLKQISAMEASRARNCSKLDAARCRAIAAWRLSNRGGRGGRHLHLRTQPRQVTKGAQDAICFNLYAEEPARLWKFYIQLVEIEAAFRNFNDDLQLRPIFHQLEPRIEAPILACSSDCSASGRILAPWR